MYKEKKDLSIKIVIVGDVGVGKSSIAIRYVYDKFDVKQQSTLGAAYMQKITTFQSEEQIKKGQKQPQINNAQSKTNPNSLKLQIWDTAGQQKYKAIAKLYYRDCRVAILVYDVMRRQSFQDLTKWYQQLIRSSPKNIMAVVVANKVDLLDNLMDQKPVKYQQGKAFADSLKVKFVQVSAKNKKGVDLLFETIANQIGPIIYKQKRQNKKQELSNSILQIKPSSRIRCCKQ